MRLFVSTRERGTNRHYYFRFPFRSIPIDAVRNVDGLTERSFSVKCKPQSEKKKNNNDTTPFTVRNEYTSIQQRKLKCV